MSGIYRGPNSSVAAQFVNADGDKGDISVSNSGELWTIDAEVIDSSKVSSIVATKITNTPSGNLTSSTVQDSLVELQLDVDSKLTSTALTAHTTSILNAHNASAISVIPSGNLASENVQSALTEIQSELDTAIALRVAKTSSIGSAVIPVGTTAQRDGSPTEGYLRYNSTLKSFEGYGTAWGSIGGGAVGGGLDKVFVGNDTLVTTDYLLGSEAITTPVTATPATNLLNATAHGFIADQLVQFSTTTTLPAPLLVETGYWVISSGLTADTFKVSLTMGGTEIDITTTGTGSHLVGKLKNYSSVNPIIATGVTVRVPSNCIWSITG